MTSQFYFRVVKILIFFKETGKNFGFMLLRLRSSRLFFVEKEDFYGKRALKTCKMEFG